MARNLKLELNERQIDVLSDALSYYELSGFGTGYGEGDVDHRGKPMHTEEEIEHIEISKSIFDQVEKLVAKTEMAAATAGL